MAVGKGHGTSGVVYGYDLGLYHSLISDLVSSNNDPCSSMNGNRNESTKSSIFSSSPHLSWSKELQGPFMSSYSMHRQQLNGTRCNCSSVVCQWQHICKFSWKGGTANKGVSGWTLNRCVTGWTLWTKAWLTDPSTAHLHFMSSANPTWCIPCNGSVAGNRDSKMLHHLV